MPRGRGGGGRGARLALIGPAFVACIAYVDPGNFATNIAGGSKYGYMLLWVLLSANLMAMLIQNLSAKIGIATGKNLPELCREHFPRPVTWGLWVQAELIAMATDLAEFVGAAIALNLLFGIPLLPSGLITAVAAFAILGLQSRGYRRFELAIIGFLGVILLGFLYDTLRIGFDAGEAAKGFVPHFDGSDSILLATGILGATVMPHVIYLHSALTQDRVKAARRRRAPRAAALQPHRRDDRHDAGGPHQHVHAGDRRVAVLRQRPRRRHDREARTRASRSSSARRRRSPSRSRCWRRASRPPASAPTPARSSCRASSPGPCRWPCAAR